MGNYRLTQDAKQDLNNIWEFGVERFGEAQADDFLLNFFDHFSEMAHRPRSYPEAEDVRENYRRSVFQKHTIYFIVLDDMIDITAIVGRQDILLRFQ